MRNSVGECQLGIGRDGRQVRGAECIGKGDNIAGVGDGQVIKGAASAGDVLSCVTIQGDCRGAGDEVSLSSSPCYIRNDDVTTHSDGTATRIQAF